MNDEISYFGEFGLCVLVWSAGGVGRMMEFFLGELFF
jgi:hypothetical protein